jgi:hypothetical protein
VSQWSETKRIERKYEGKWGYDGYNVVYMKYLMKSYDEMFSFSAGFFSRVVSMTERGFRIKVFRSTIALLRFMTIVDV